MIDDNDKKTIQEMIDRAIRIAVSFSTRKRGDTPNDAYQLTPQLYVNLNGSVVGRPVGSIANIGQFYMATDTNKPMWFNTNKQWVDGVGSVIAIN